MLAFLKAVLEDYHYSVYTYRGAHGYGPIVARLKALKDAASWVWAGVVCRFKGHEWVDDSYGGRESGCMAGHCTRCGYTWHHQLY